MPFGVRITETQSLQKNMQHKNVYGESKSQLMSAEQIITMNPDVIILATNSILPDINILSTAPKYKPLQNVNAVKIE